MCMDNIGIDSTLALRPNKSSDDIQLPIFENTFGILIMEIGKRI
jgi:hypothetical protein